MNVQANQRIDTVESILNKKLDGFQSEIDQKFDNLQYSISRLTNYQNVHQEEENPEEGCMIDTTVEEHCKQQNEAISPLLTEEGNGKEAVEEPPKSLFLNHFPQNWILVPLPKPPTTHFQQHPLLTQCSSCLHLQHIRHLKHLLLRPSYLHCLCKTLGS